MTLEVRSIDGTLITTTDLAAFGITGFNSAYRIFMLSGNRVYVGGQTSANGYPFIIEVSIDGAGTVSLVNSKQVTELLTGASAINWYPTDDGQGVCVAYSSTKFVMLNLSLAVTYTITLTGGAGNVLYAGDIDTDRNLLAYIPTSNGYIYVKNYSSNTDVLKVTGDQYSNIAIRSNYIIVTYAGNIYKYTDLGVLISTVARADISYVYHGGRRNSNYVVYIDLYSYKLFIFDCVTDTVGYHDVGISTLSGSSTIRAENKLINDKYLLCGTRNGLKCGLYQLKSKLRRRS
jgi:hypothetical protein